MAINKNELSQEELANVNGGYGEYNAGGNEYGGGGSVIEFGSDLHYSPTYPYYLNTYLSNINICAGFKLESGPTTFACCAACDYSKGNLCTLRTKDNDPYA